MFSTTVNLNEIAKVQKFVNIITTYEDDIDLVRGRYVIDAKSVMGIFSLDLSNPIDIVIHTDSTDVANKFLAQMEQFK